MKAKVHSQQSLSKKKFFLLIIAPFLIGLMIFMTTQAHATWDRKDDPCLLQSPTQQGWMKVDFRDISSPFKSDQESVQFASR